MQRCGGMGQACNKHYGVLWEGARSNPPSHPLQPAPLLLAWGPAWPQLLQGGHSTSPSAGIKSKTVLPAKTCTPCRASAREGAGAAVGSSERRGGEAAGGGACMQQAGEAVWPGARTGTTSCTMPLVWQPSAACKQALRRAVAVAAAGLPTVQREEYTSSATGAAVGPGPAAAGCRMGWDGAAGAAAAAGPCRRRTKTRGTGVCCLKACSVAWCCLSRAPSAYCNGSHGAGWPGRPSWQPPAARPKCLPRPARCCTELPGCTHYPCGMRSASLYGVLQAAQAWVLGGAMAGCLTSRRRQALWAQAAFARSQWTDADVLQSHITAGSGQRRRLRQLVWGERRGCGRQRLHASWAAPPSWRQMKADARTAFCQAPGDRQAL